MLIDVVRMNDKAFMHYISIVNRLMSWNFFLRFLSLSSIILVIAAKGRSRANHVRLMVRGELVKGLETLRALR